MTQKRAGRPGKRVEPGWQLFRLYLPAYRFSEAARLAGTTTQSISRWYRGYEVPGHRMRPVLPSDGGGLLAYRQLVEVAFVASFRRLGVKLDTLRKAHDYCRKTFESEHPFAELRFKTDGVHVLALLADYDPTWAEEERLIVTDVGGQLVWEPAIRDRLDQFDYEENLALRWYPRGRSKVIVVDPRVTFGAPIIRGTGVPTAVVRERYQAGETLEDIQEDFGIPRLQLEQALEFEEVRLSTAA